jgi:hypothetical protein
MILMRKSYPDRPLGAEKLEALGDLWSDWCESESRGSPVKPLLSQEFQVQLWGFPRSRAEPLTGALRRCLAAGGFPGDCVERTDADTLTVRCPPAPFRSAWPRGLIGRLLFETAFDGLDAELRFSVQESGDGPNLPTLTLVVRGLLGGGLLLLKALYQADHRVDLERLFHGRQWEGEALCLQSLDERDKAPAGVGLSRSGSYRPAHERPGLLSIRRAIDAPGDNKLLGFLKRIGACTAPFVIGAGLATYQAWNFRPPLWDSPIPFMTAVILMAIGLLGIGLLFWLKGGEIVRRYHNMKAARQRAFTSNIEFPHLDLASQGVIDNPVAAKYSQELQELGAVHLFDSRLQLTNLSTYVRFFLLPKDGIYLLFNITLNTKSYRYFPARPSLVAHAFFSDDYRLVATNSHSRSPPPVPPGVAWLRLPGADSPQEFVARCREAVGKTLDAGRQLAPVLSPDELVAKIAEARRQSGEWARRYGYYTWRQAIADSFSVLAEQDL